MSNQILVRFDATTAEAGDVRTRAVIERVQRDGVCWAGGSVYAGRAVIRISISNWSTSERDVNRSIEAIAAAARGVTDSGSAASGPR